MIHALQNRESAVSPVVGVMLMLVVTIIIAAVVSAFAGGFSEGAKKAPQSTVQATPDINEHMVTFEHNGGDPFSLNEIEVVFQNKDLKIALSPKDVGTSCVAFNMSSGSGTMVKAGYSFVVQGSDPGSTQGIVYGQSGNSMTLKADDRITWIVVDKRSSKAIATGEMVL
ncbi:MAG: type IV pilin [Methanoregula sp.]|nr:type IV pilin [Methanoregula sp.]